jgi:NAD(P)-dependent dehydrogenase (short-subunit alcohol dehydrogenase family)
MRVAGKVAIVTSGTRGIGRACAERLAEDGASVVVGDSLEPVAPFADPDITFHRLDVTDEASWTCIVADTIGRHGRLDILVNNAAQCRDATLDLCSLEDWNRFISTNETGVFLGMRSVIPEMRKVGGGAIVNVLSMLGPVAVADAIALQATKGAVTLLTRSAAVSLMADNIRVNSVHPGYVEASSMRRRRGPTPTLAGPQSAGRAGEPRDIANGVLFLVSDEASYITGTGLLIDGGISALQ